MVLTRAQSRHNVHGDAALSDNEGEGGIGNANGSGAGTTPVKQAKVEEQQQQQQQQQHGNGKNKSKDAIIQPSTGTYEASPRTTSYEFLGPPGAFLISTLVPYFSYFFAYACDERGCPSTPFVPYMQQGWAHIQTAHFWKELLLDRRGYEIYFGWYAFTVLCWAVLPGKWIDGGALRNGQRLTYKINAVHTFFASLAAAASIFAVYGTTPFLAMFDHWVGLVTASLVMSILQATYCYATSFIPGTMLAVGGNSGNVLYDWFIGRELNPRIGIFDIKTFNELRPGLILWFLLDVSMAIKQYSLLGRVTDSMALVLVFQGIYVFDAVYNEAGILTQMDITTDGFGFMLAVGDLTWVTFTYGLQARYLALYPKDLGYFWTAVIVGVNALGYCIFRISNEEKNEFRNGRNPKNLTYMKTERGTNLLTSGWWGRSRHPNYLGDWIMAWAWCLPTGFNTPLTYFYVVYFAILLVHRQLRDDEACHKKYGKDWERYCKLVSSRIIPGLY